jgi:flavin reductase (DIM6/NTAB) family NADH-FMN oxidoreductase RutF
MSKVNLGQRALIYPAPAVLVGANVAGKANFMTAAFCGIVNGQPPMVSTSLQHHRYTLVGIKENDTFSVNIPSVDIMTETDYCGIVSGNKTDKVADCKFSLFYGKLTTAPMIDQCPINLECKVVHILNLGTHALVIGQVEDTFITESCLTDGKPDVEKIKPFLSAMGQYREFGKTIGTSHILGKQLKPQLFDNPKQ